MEEKTSIQKLNDEYIKIRQSREYAYGNIFVHFLNSIKNLNITELLRLKRLKNNQKKIKKMNKKKERFYEINKEIGESTVAVYSAMFGNYDDIQEHFYHDKVCDFYIFTDSNNTRKLENIKVIEVDKPKNWDTYSSVEKNRYCKMLGYLQFQKYDYSIYIDSNLIICGNISNYIKYINQNSGIAMYNHYSRGDLYDEIDVCILQNRGNIEKLKELKIRMDNEKMPHSYGMCECNVIIRENKNLNCKHIMEDWFEEFCQSNTNRDQVLLPYILWKNSITIDEIGCIGENINLDSMFYRFKHRGR